MKTHYLLINETYTIYLLVKSYNVQIIINHIAKSENFNYLIETL